MNNARKAVEYLLELTEIHSPSGFTREAAEYCFERLKGFGFSPVYTKKGGIICDLGGQSFGADENDALLLTAHIDTLGGMVKEIKPNGRLRISPVGGLQPHNTEGENCVIFTRFSKSYSGTFQLDSPSVHVNKDYSTAERGFNGMEIVIDEKVKTKEETEALGISTGDYVCFDPRTILTQSGYIKSRFLDDKLSVAILLSIAESFKKGRKPPKRHTILHITVYEEVGHGGASIPDFITEVLGVDMGCVGEGLTCDEHMVSICAKDSHSPSDYEMTTELIRCCKDKKLSYAVDVYPFYGSDADAALSAGYDLRHALIGAGVYASHGYERSHTDGVMNTLELILAYIDR